MSAPFPNGSAHRMFDDRWCSSCAHDHDIHTDKGGGCQIILDLLIDPDKWPAEFIGDTVTGPEVCTKYTPCEPCGGDPWPQARSAAIAAQGAKP